MQIEIYSKPFMYTLYIVLIFPIKESFQLITFILLTFHSVIFFKGIVSKLTISFWMYQKCGKMKDYQKKKIIIK
jgi:hypothetical protein